MQPTPIAFTCSAAEEGVRVDQALVARVPGMSRARARDLAAAGKVRQNGRRCAKGARVREGDLIELEEAPRPADFVPAPDPTVQVTVVLEDPLFLVVDKPAPMACHPLRPEERGTVVQALLAHYPELAGVGYAQREAGLVHRIDMDTSGLLLLARTAEAFDGLVGQLRSGAIDKRNLALVEGEGSAPRRIELPIASHPTDPRRVVASADEREIARIGARPAVTEVLEARPVGSFTLVEVRARSARRHQVRAHLAAIGHPLVGDARYGGAAMPGLARHFLHASSLVFTHPRTGADVEARSELGPDLRAVLEQAAG